MRTERLWPPWGSSADLVGAATFTDLLLLGAELATSGRCRPRGAALTRSAVSWRSGRGWASTIFEIRHVDVEGLLLNTDQVVAVAPATATTMPTTSSTC